METISLIPVPAYCGPPPRFQVINGLCVETPPPSCAPGFVNDPVNPYQCVPAVATCTMTISYPANAPETYIATPLNAAVCDADGLALVLASLLARVLGAPR